MLTNDEVELAECIIRNNIQEFNDMLAKRTYVENKPQSISYKMLSGYFRQYEGERTKNGSVVVRIYFAKEPLGEFLIEVFNQWITEGASYEHFGVTVNLSDGKMESFTY
jgi:hypothetical protein